MIIFCHNRTSNPLCLFMQYAPEEMGRAARIELELIKKLGPIESSPVYVDTGDGAEMVPGLKRIKLNSNQFADLEVDKVLAGFRMIPRNKTYTMEEVWTDNADEQRAKLLRSASKRDRTW